MKTWKVVLVTAAVMAAAAVQAAPFVILRQPDGTQRRMDGMSISRRANMDVVLTTAEGQFTFTADQVIRAEAAKPDDFDRAQALLEAGNYEESVRMFNDIARRLRGLTWDVRALRQVARAYEAQQNWMGVAETFERIFVDNPDMREQAQVIWPYLDALVATEQMDKLEPMLERLIRTGRPEEAAKAQILRGDIRTRKGLHRDAVMDYLRTVVFYERVQDLMPEALYKTARALEELRDPRAREWYAKLEGQYPQSQYAQQARERNK